MPLAPNPSVWSPALGNLGADVVGPPTGLRELPRDTVPATAPTSTGDTTGLIISAPGLLVVTGTDAVFGGVFAGLFGGIYALISVFHFSEALTVGALVYLVVGQPARCVEVTAGVSLPTSVPGSADFSDTYSDLLPRTTFGGGGFVFFIWRVGVGRLIAVVLRVYRRVLAM